MFVRITWYTIECIFFLVFLQHTNIKMTLKIHTKWMLTASKFRYFGYICATIHKSSRSPGICLDSFFHMDRKSAFMKRWRIIFFPIHWFLLTNHGAIIKYRQIFFRFVHHPKCRFPKLLMSSNLKKNNYMY